MSKKLHSGNLYWPTTMSGEAAYPGVQTDIQTQTVIVGGGMSGIMCGYIFAKSGIPCVAVERGAIADGSTSANTGLLQFSNDIMLWELIEQIGEHDAVAFYRACKTAIEQLARAAGDIPADVGFRRRSSLYFASSEQDLPKLNKEFEALNRSGFDVEYWQPRDIAARFPFSKPGAIVTHGDAEVNPYQFVHGLAGRAVQEGLQLYEHTDIVSHETGHDGKHRLLTADGYTLTCDQVVFAVGYEPEELKGKLVKAELNRSFVAVSAPQQDLSPWHERFMLWETARPYLYMRTTVDGRVVIGGLDEESQAPIEGKHARQKRTEKLYKLIAAYFPSFDAPLEYEWSATFGESSDNLPFIGEDPHRRGVYYCLGYGGNGTVYSTIGSLLLRDLIAGYDNPLARIVGLERATLAKV
ncbi:NAD(P)/FAD-dependent oxidoreductase [Paenibacillus protaetiae]|uniref:FAD-binding oxidoreductase n=1 Tax=Paenibacillus protaetiae TaxID=2509456 RepID=A0A4V0YF92_9BACL|nr:FAD-binding oxidoreductase [Paenibacillus protaetiae]QAY66901.1 FAD-binding oxidoreductase [Paenibacillus protaetiae]